MKIKMLHKVFHMYTPEQIMQIRIAFAVFHLHKLLFVARAVAHCAYSYSPLTIVLLSNVDSGKLLSWWQHVYSTYSKCRHQHGKRQPIKLQACMIYSSKIPYTNITLAKFYQLQTKKVITLIFLQFLGNCWEYHCQILQFTSYPGPTLSYQVVINYLNLDKVTDFLA